MCGLDSIVVSIPTCHVGDRGSIPRWDVSFLLKIPVKPLIFRVFLSSCDSIVVNTLHCGCNNPGSNPGHGKCTYQFFIYHQFLINNGLK